MSQENTVTDYPDTSEGSNQADDRKKPKKLNSGTMQKVAPPQADDGDTTEDSEAPKLAPPRRSGGRRMVPVHQSRIADRPPKDDDKDSSLKIKIELDLEVEVEIYARVKGDVMVGLM
ncbi:hypothetical protein OPT61_g3835 [Boeremia exigua]|uniref:Uncharacterized protein n=1 Tax=Boeremia exigua TaxID=749465 RepID=A0ACC2IGA9_9PLEO|nr:hypothetical protein OPT61_g3835 [Boeremia exigua]